MSIISNPYIYSLTIEEPTTQVSIGGQSPLNATLNNQNLTIGVSVIETLSLNIPAVQGVSGAQGLPGISFQGPYSSTTLYHSRDVVTYQGSSWILISVSALNSIPSISSVDWSIIAQKGDVGSANNSALDSTVNSTLSGLIDGINLIYVLSNTPLTNSSILVYINGLLQTPLYFSISGRVITLNSPLIPALSGSPSDSLSIAYSY